MGSNSSVLPPISVNNVDKRDLENIAVSENIFKRLYDNLLKNQTNSETSVNENNQPDELTESSENVKDSDDDKAKRTENSEEKIHLENSSKDENLWEMYKEFTESKEEKRTKDEQEVFEKFKKFAANTDSENGKINKEQMFQKFEEFTDHMRTTTDDEHFFSGHKKFTADMNPKQKTDKTDPNDETNHQQSTHCEEELTTSKEQVKDFVDHRNAENKPDSEEGAKLFGDFNEHSNIKDDENKSADSNEHSNIKDEENKSEGLQSTDLENNRIGDEDAVKNCASGLSLEESVNDEDTARDDLQEKGSELVQEEEWMQKLLNADANHSEKNQLTMEGYNDLLKNIDGLLNKSRNSHSCNLAKAELLRCYQSNSVTSLKCQYAVDNFTNCVDDMTVRGKNKWLTEAPKGK